MPIWIGYIVSLVSGGLSGALINRYFLNRDRAIKKLTLKIEKEEIRSMIPVTFKEKDCNNLIYKEFTLTNTTNDDFKELDIVFEFDRGSEIVDKEVSSPRYGKNKFLFTAKKPSELVYHIKNFNRKHQITFIFEVANISENFFSAIVDNCGVDINVIHSPIVSQPSISPSRIVDKLRLDMN